MQKGDHDIIIEGFQRGGGIYQTATYSGPDTGGSRLLIRSVGDGSGELPPLPPPSAWRPRMYKSNRNLHHVPNVRFMDYVGGATVPFIDFHSLTDFRRYIGKTPHRNYAWVFHGSLNVKRAGTYTFCTQSDDG